MASSLVWIERSRNSAATTKPSSKDLSQTTQSRVIVNKVERLAETPGQRGASPCSRIRNYITKCEPDLEEERARVRQAKRQSRTAAQAEADLLADERAAGIR